MNRNKSILDYNKNNKRCHSAANIICLRQKLLKNYKKITLSVKLNLNQKELYVLCKIQTNIVF